MTLPKMRICYHGEVGHRFACAVEPVHIKPHGAPHIICDSPRRVRMKAPAFVSGLMGATCKRCRERFLRRERRARIVAAFAATKAARQAAAGFVTMFALALTFTLSAQTITLCQANEKACKLTQPMTFQMKKAQPPYNAPVMSGGPVTVSGAPYWLWLKAGEPPTPCTAKTHASAPGGNEPRCSAKIGDALYITQQFTVKAARAAALTAEQPRVQLSIAPSCSSLTEQFTVPRYACLRIISSAGVVTFEVAHYPANRSRFSILSGFPVAADGSITIPYNVEGGPLGTRRVALYAIDSEGAYSQFLPETRLLDLPIWTGQ